MMIIMIIPNILFSFPNEDVKEKHKINNWRFRKQISKSVRVGRWKAWAWFRLSVKIEW